MQIENIHQREIAAPLSEVAALLQTLGSEHDQVWPNELWMDITFDGPLEVGTKGGHGPIRYAISEIENDRRMRFQFTAPEGFDGFHEFNLNPLDENRCVLQHSIQADLSLPAVFLWSLVVRPLHDALVEDAMDKVERSLGLIVEERGWSRWVRYLRKKRGYA